MAVEERFAQRLASNDLPVRNRAVKRLTRWIEARSALEDGFTELELLKLWKGLFVCMWHSDKPLVQAELAGTIAQLIHVFDSPDGGLHFISIFFVTMAREWFGIDRLRLDKFYTLIRKMVRQSFDSLQRSNWNKELVGHFLVVLSEGPLNTDTTKACLGVQLHVLEVYLPELVAVTAKGEFPPVADLVAPCFSLLANTTNSTIIHCVEKNIVQPLEDTRTIERFQVHWGHLAGVLRKLAIDRKTAGRNRKRLYVLCKRFSDMSEELQKAVGAPKKKKKKRRVLEGEELVAAGEQQRTRKKRRKIT